MKFEIEEDDVVTMLEARLKQIEQSPNPVTKALEYSLSSNKTTRLAGETWLKQHGCYQA
jgi:hypothetical protein